MGTYGIDLGTTYSCIARLDRNGNPEVIRNDDDGSDTLASVVFFETPDNVVVGQNAKEMIESDGDRVVQYVKREMAKDEPRQYEFFGKTYSPADISCLILKRLKAIVEQQGDTVDDVVITCPARFSFPARILTKQAGINAGFNVLNIINEPTAAALSYCSRQFKEEKTILVYDLGGGTFDVTVVKMHLEENDQKQEVHKIKVIASRGNDQLGGVDWDDRLFDHVVKVCCDDNGIERQNLNPDTLQLIRSRVETAKKKLSQVENTNIRVSIKGQQTRVDISRESFESMTSDLVYKTMTYVNAVLEELGNLEIDTVLLVGGSTYMPMIRKAVEDKFPGKVQIEEPNCAVAKGAAICASMLVDEVDPDPDPEPETKSESESNDTPDIQNSGETKPRRTASLTKEKIVIGDITSCSFGPGVLNEQREFVVDNIIKLGEEMPCSVKKEYTIPEDNMECVFIHIFEDMSKDDHVIPCVNQYGEEQESHSEDQVKLLGTMNMLLPKNTRKGTPVEVTFTIDASGIYVSAVNLNDPTNIVDTKIDYAFDIGTGKSPAAALSVNADIQ